MLPLQPQYEFELKVVKFLGAYHFEIKIFKVCSLTLCEKNRKAIDMEMILQIIEYIFFIAVTGGILYMTIFYLNYSKHKKKKSKIANLEAKLITLRLALRMKIKIKVNSFRSQFAEIISQGSEIDRAIKELSDIQYDTSADFQKHFDVSRQINTLINADLRINRAKNADLTSYNSALPEESSIKILEEFMGPDYKNEIAIIRIIKEIADIKIDLNRNIENYNIQYKDQKKRPQITKVEPLEFEALADINLIFKDSKMILDEMQKKHSTIYFKSMAA